MGIKQEYLRTGKNMKIILTIIMLLFASPLWATPYYVDCNADAGGDGTTQETTGGSCAWDTLSDVNGASFNPGDTIYFNRGCTWSGLLDIPSPGDTDDQLVFSAYGEGALPIIDGTGGGADTNTVTMNEDYVTLEYLNIKNGKRNNIGHANAADYCIIQYCVVEGAYRQGIYMGQSDAANAEHWTIQYNTFQNNGTSTTLDHGIYIKWANDWLIQGNLLDSNATFGVYLNGTTDCVVRYNYSTGHNPGGFLEMLENNAGGSTGSHIYGNVSYDDRKFMYVSGANHSNNYVYNNTASEFAYSALAMENSGDLTSVKNNIFYSTVADSRVYASHSGCLISSSSNNILKGDASIRYNDSYYATLALFQSGTSLETDSLDSDPVFTTSGSDFTLQVTSPAIDEGVNLGTSYDDALDPDSSWPDSVALLDQNLHGTGWEIGAFVYEDAAPEPTVGISAGSGTISAGSGSIAAQ